MNPGPAGLDAWPAPDIRYHSAPMDEFTVIDRFFKNQRVHRDDVPLGIGDDAAWIQGPAGGGLVVTTDVLVAGVHFPDDTAPADVGHKALAVNLSDIAAMGAAPAWATLALTLPGVDEPWLESFASGFFELATRYDVQLVGGDTTRGPLSIAVQLIGLVGDAGCLTRGGASEGDLVYVSGTLGDAGLGLRIIRGALEAPLSDTAFLLHRLNRPTPRVELGRALAGIATAAIDVSDGLAADLEHLCVRSAAGAVVEIADVPLSGAYRRLLPEVGWESALSFGDDYELCFTVAPGDASTVEQLGRDHEVPVTHIGRITGDAVKWLSQGRPFSPHGHGYQHFS